MAGNSPKAQDPAEAALSAVEEALKLDFGGPIDEAGTSPAPETDAASATPEAPDVSTETEPTTETPQNQQAVSKERRARRGRSGRQNAANDDRRSIGNLIYALQLRPSSAPIWMAFMLSVVWLAIGGGILWSLYGPEIMGLTSIEQLIQYPVLVGGGIAIILPIAFFWVLAVMIRRAQEMRIVARGMTEVALRLAEPEDIAKESVLSVGQAIRREVAAMGDGIERAMARASEL